jgi:uncharacterized membrane protein
MNKSVFDLNENLAAAFAYVGAFITGIIVLIMEKENKFVRFAALQSTIFFGAMLIIGAVLGVLSNIWLIGWIFSLVRGAFGVGTFLIWLYLVFTAYKGQAVKLPILGDICWEQVHK